MTGVFARILLRYLAAVLVARGFMTDNIGTMLAGDADVLSAVTAAVGIAMAAAVEGWYFLARKFGWST